MSEVTSKNAERIYISETVSSRSLAQILFGLQMILLLCALDQTVVSCAMPKIIAKLNGFDRYAWVTTAYLLTCTIATPIFGKLSDLIGRRKVLLAGVVIFTLASLLCGCAGYLSFPFFDSMNQLILARAIQGAGAGVITGLTFTLVADLFPPRERGRYQGYFAAVFAAASLVGPSLGGLIADRFDWRWIFFLNVPFGLAAFLTFNGAFPKEQTAPSLGKQRSFNFTGTFLFACAFCALLISGTLITKAGLTDLSTMVSALLAIALLCAFMIIDSKSAERLLPKAFLTNRTLLVSAVSLVVTGIGMFGALLLVPIYLESAFGMSATAAGGMLTPLIVVVALVSILSGLLMSKTGRYKGLILGGLFFMASGSFLLSSLTTETAIALVLAAMILVGVGLGALLPVYTIVIQNSIEAKDVGAATTFGQFFRSVGGTIGAALFGALMLKLYNSKLADLIPTDLPKEAVALLSNPLEPEKLTAALTRILPMQPDQVSVLVNATKQAIVFSVDKLFVFYGVLLLVTLGLNLLLLKEIALGKSRSAPRTADDCGKK